VSVYRTKFQSQPLVDREIILNLSQDWTSDRLHGNEPSGSIEGGKLLN